MYTTLFAEINGRMRVSNGLYTSKIIIMWKKRLFKIRVLEMIFLKNKGYKTHYFRT